MDLVDIFTGSTATAVTIIPVLVCVHRAAMWMVEGEIDAITGTSAIFVALALLAVSQFSSNIYVPTVILVVLVTSMLFFPFAQTLFSERMHRQIDTDELQRAHEALERDGTNVHAMFEVSRVLHKAGMAGHAIGVAEAAASRLSSAPDPITNRSARDAYRRELYALEDWKRNASKEDFEQVACPRCKRLNPPGSLACLHCGGPFLLDLSRMSTYGDRFLPRLVYAWIALMLTLSVATVVGSQTSGREQLLAVGTCVALGGFAIASLVRAPTMKSVAGRYSVTSGRDRDR
jgi:hypothetical protein